MKIMAVDLGDARTGLAVCDRTEFLASPIGVLHDRVLESILNKVAIATTEYDVKMVVVGHPLNMNGSAGDRAKKCEEFARQLQERLEIPVVLWDERSTTVSAHNILSENAVYGKKRRDTVDEVAAAIILEGFMAWRRNHPGEPAPGRLSDPAGL
ncbi:MAG: Holliday junction resolvase RuvX [Provencibacterium sp.]|jgi:putative Holliday junction resolvase|nr:Holliday junction resolvase RuvX [Provencibacterium sp.]